MASDGASQNTNERINSSSRFASIDRVPDQTSATSLSYHIQDSNREEKDQSFDEIRQLLTELSSMVQDEGNDTCSNNDDDDDDNEESKYAENINSIDESLIDKNMENNALKDDKNEDEVLSDIESGIWDKIELAEESDHEEEHLVDDIVDRGEFGMPYHTSTGLNWTALVSVSITTVGGSIPIALIYYLKEDFQPWSKFYLLLLASPSTLSIVLDCFISYSPSQCLEWIQFLVCFVTSCILFWKMDLNEQIINLDKIWFTSQIFIFIGVLSGIYLLSRSLAQRAESHLTFYQTRSGVLSNLDEENEILESLTHTMFAFIAIRWRCLLNPMVYQVLYLLSLLALLPFLINPTKLSGYFNTCLLSLFVHSSSIILVFTAAFLTNALPATGLSSSKFMLWLFMIVFAMVVFLAIFGITMSLLNAPVYIENSGHGKESSIFIGVNVAWFSGLLLNMFSLCVASLMMIRVVMRRGSELDDLIHYFRVKANQEHRTEINHTTPSSSSSSSTSTDNGTITADMLTSPRGSFSRRGTFSMDSRSLPAGPVKETGWGSRSDSDWPADWVYHQAAFPCSSLLLPAFLHSAVYFVPLVLAHAFSSFAHHEASNQILHLLSYDLLTCLCSFLIFGIVFIVELLLPNKQTLYLLACCCMIASLGMLTLRIYFSFLLCSPQFDQMASFNGQANDGVHISWIVACVSQSWYFLSFGTCFVWFIRTVGTSKFSGPLYHGALPCYLKSSASRLASKGLGWHSFFLLSTAPFTMVLDSVAHFQQGSVFLQRNSSSSSSLNSEDKIFFSVPITVLMITIVLVLMNVFAVVRTRLVGPILLEHFYVSQKKNQPPSSPSRWLSLWIQRATALCLLLSSIALLWYGALKETITGQEVHTKDTDWSPVVVLVSSLLRVVSVVFYMQLQGHGMDGAAALDLKLRAAHLARGMALRDPNWVASSPAPTSSESSSADTTTATTEGGGGGWVPSPRRLLSGSLLAPAGTTESNALSIRVLTASGDLWRRARPGGNGRNLERLKGRLAEWVRDVNEEGEVVWVPASEASRRRLITDNDDAKTVLVDLKNLNAVNHDTKDQPTSTIGKDDDFVENGGGGGAIPGAGSKHVINNLEGVSVVRRLSSENKVEWVSAEEMSSEGSLSIRGISITNSPPYLVIPSSELASLAHESFDFKELWFTDKVHKLRIPWAGGHQEVKVHRKEFLKDSIKLISSFSPKKFHQTWRFQYVNEPGIDGGGVAREWWDHVIALTFEPKNELFMFSATDHLSYQPNSLYYHYFQNETFNSSQKGLKIIKQIEEAYRFVGRLLGKALLDRQMVGAYLNGPMWKHLLGHPVCFDDLALVDETLFQTLSWMLTHDNVHELDVYFAIDEVIEMKDDKEQDFDGKEGGDSGSHEIEMMNIFRNDSSASSSPSPASVMPNASGDDTLAGDESTKRKQSRVVTRELVPGGASMLVTDDNKQQFVELRFRDTMLEKPRHAIGSLLKGLYEIVPFPLISIFKPNELELLLCGMPKINVDDWKANTNYAGGYYGYHPAVRTFWTVIAEDLTEIERCKLLQFVTGTSRLPSGGFKQLQGSDGEIKLFTLDKISATSVPRAHTCFNRLDLPAISDRVELAQLLKLLLLADVDGFNVA